jgi:hypothetical protein
MKTRNNSNCRTADRKIRTEASLTTVAMDHAWGGNTLRVLRAAEDYAKKAKV